jgi:outer membrane protein TolC
LALAKIWKAVLSYGSILRVEPVLVRGHGPSGAEGNWPLTADFFPEVRLEGNYGYSAFQYDSETGPKSGSNAAGINGYGAFLNVKWDLFDGFERVERVRKRADEEKAVKENLDAARLDASRDVWTSYHDTLSAARRVDFAEAFVASAQENFSTTLARLALAVGTVR